MPKKRTTTLTRTDELLRKILIVQLGLAGVGQKQIQTIAGADIRVVNSVVKLLRKRVRK